MKDKLIPEIINRKSSYNFSNKKILNDEIQILIEATKWAPSSRNMQPWRVVFVSNESESYNSLFNSLRESNQEWAKNCSLFAVFCVNDDKRLNKKFLDVGYAGQNLMLQSERLEIETHPIGGWHEDKVKEALKIPNENHVVFILAMGKRGDPDNLENSLKEQHNRKRNRNPNKDNFSFNYWNF
tara:strand:+ start:933 stop:1481 length:549 start_codon:yes stop_codon:yes gene_type:complete